MEFIRTHPYRAGLAGALMLVLAGIAIVNWRSAPPMAASPSAWGGNGTLFNPEIIPNSDVESAGGTIGARDVPLYHYRPPASDEESDGFDFNAFIASLREPAASTETDTGSSSETPFSYSFIPTGLISTETPSRQRSPLEESLYAYGNDIGEYIQTYEGTHRNNAIILRNQIEDRGNAEKAAAVRAIGADLRALGASLKGVENVPEVFAYAHAALANSYIETGLKLSAIPDAGGDQATIAAINSYNATADSFIKNYVAVATLFSVNNIRFGPGDAGSVFMFSGQ